MESKSGHCFRISSDSSNGNGSAKATSSPTKSSNQDALEPFPMLLAVRFGTAIKIPGMNDTLLHVGMNDSIVETMGRMTNNLRWAYDTYARYLRQYGTLVCKVPD